MVDAGDRKKIVAGISDEQVLKLEQAAIRIPRDRKSTRLNSSH